MKKIFIGIAILVVVGIIVFVSFQDSDGVQFETATVERGAIIQEVSVTGKVKAVQSVNLAFEKSGRVEQVFVRVGNFVTSGTLLAEQENTELTTQLAKATAELKTQEAKLSESEVALQNLYASVTDIINGAFTEANDAVRTQVDEMFTDDETNPQLVFQTTNIQFELDAEAGRENAGDLLNEWQQELPTIQTDSSPEVLGAVLSKTRSRLMTIRAFLDRTWDAAVNTISVSESTINAYKVSINTARGAVNTALADVNDQSQAISAQRAAISSQQATVNTQDANIKNIEAQIAKTQLRSPINGTVTVQDAEVGEIVGANTAVISIISSGQLEVESFIPEVDIANITIGNDATITLDAYGNDVVFESRVTAIDPAETVIEGVSTYKTTLRFTNPDERIRSGMTANIDILTNMREDVLLIPQRAVIRQNDSEIVRIPRGELVEEVPIVTGLRGSNGTIEVLEGIEEGQEVITFLPEE